MHFVFQLPPNGSESLNTSMLAYTPNNVESFTNKWNTFVVNLNGIKPGFRNGIKNGITATVTPRDHTNTISTPMSPPYIVAPSFEMRWPIKNGHFNGQNGRNSTQIPVSNSYIQRFAEPFNFT